MQFLLSKWIMVEYYLFVVHACYHTNCESEETIVKSYCRFTWQRTLISSVFTDPSLQIG